MKQLNQFEVDQVNGGITATQVVAGIYVVAELPHMMHGFIEFVNYVEGLRQNGPQEGDYFGNFFNDNLVKPVKGFVGG